MHSSLHRPSLHAFDCLDCFNIVNAGLTILSLHLFLFYKRALLLQDSSEQNCSTAGATEAICELGLDSQRSRHYFRNPKSEIQPYHPTKCTTSHELVFDHWYSGLSRRISIVSSQFSTSYWHCPVVNCLQNFL